MESKSTISRRKLIKRTTAAGAALGGVALQAQSPGVLRGSNAGRKFRAYVTRGNTGSSVEELTLLPIQPRQVLVRIEACAPCYTTIPRALPQATGGPAANRGRAEVPNHAAVGVVEEIGALVKRVQKGDRVVVAGTSQCGQCFQCLHGDPDFCQFTFGGDVFPPFATAADGTPVAAQAGVGGSSELAAVTEEYCCPVFTDVPAIELSLLGDQLTSGLCGRYVPHEDRGRLERRRVWRRTSRHRGGASG